MALVSLGRSRSYLSVDPGSLLCWSLCMEPSKRIGDYEVLAEIGRGGMGKVFRVRNVLSDRIDAMKVLLPNLVESPELAARFLREIKVLAALNHPHIAALRHGADRRQPARDDHGVRRGPIAGAAAALRTDSDLRPSPTSIRCSTRSTTPTSSTSSIETSSRRT
jgi:Serine/threonine protein kinase